MHMMVLFCTPGDKSLGRNPLVTRFLRSALRLKPATHTRILAWDLTVVLEILCRALFEPIEEVPENC